MRLLQVVVDKRMELSGELELKHDYLKSVWQFYQVYSVCLNLTGLEDPKIRMKNQLISSLISKFSYSVYAKLVRFMKEDMKVINLAYDIFESNKGDDGQFFGDYYQFGMLGVGVYD